ncbi:ATP-binding protein [Streptomyces sp. NPDC056401]|uniref:ATP-binding protein n=1 Tax=Streptomyces sp. NPDC056401 TaxID=3345809 RepID=UPI0035DADBD6
MRQTALSVLHTETIRLHDQTDPEVDQVTLTFQRHGNPRHTAADVSHEDARLVGEIRSVVHRWLAHRGLLPLIESACLLTSEVVTNALVHGSGSSLRFAMERQLETVGIRVADGSPARPRVRKPATDEECGRGMLIVEALADEWGVSEDGTETWFTLSSPAGDG